MSEITILPCDQKSMIDLVDKMKDALDEYIKERGEPITFPCSKYPFRKQGHSLGVLHALLLELSGDLSLRKQEVDDAIINSLRRELSVGRIKQMSENNIG